MIDISEIKFGLVSLGCDKNRVDAEKLLARIKLNGGTIVNDIESADVLIINTCAFLNESRKEAIETILEYAQYKERGLRKIVVTGCLPQKYIGEIFEELVEVDAFLGFNDYDKFFEALNLTFMGERVNYVGRGENVLTLERTISTPLHYAYLKIADGCNNHCTYCLIPKIRGKYVSFPMESLIEEAKGLGDISELILVAQDVTRYGIDLYGQKKLINILQNLTTLVNINSVRLLYCYPDMIDDELIEEIKNNPKIIKYLDIPLQHSEDRILKLMNRKGTREEYLSLIRKLREEIPEIAIRSTFIGGFPTESEEEVEGLCDFLKEAQLDNCGFFAYSRELDTAAYRLKGQIKQSVKNSRVKKLYAVQREVSRNKLQNLVGKKIKIICDGVDLDLGCFIGRAYFQAPDIDGKVYFNSPNCSQGEYVDIIVDKSDDYDLFGHTEDYIND